nr:MAG TPA: Major head protein [Caudoviricetes sp.]
MAEFTVIETQEQFDDAIKARLERERAKIRKEFDGFLSPEDAQKKYENYLSPEQVQEKYKEYFSPEEMAKKDAEIDGYKLNSKRVEIALKNGIPYELAGKVSGNTEEEMTKDAETLAGFLKSNTQSIMYKADPVGGKDSIDAELGQMLGNLSI